MKENATVATVLRAVELLEGGYFYRNNTGVAWERGRPIEYGDPGSGDIMGAFLGRAVAIECKSKKGKQRDSQKLWQAKWEAAGGLYVLPLKMMPEQAAAYTLEQLGVKPGHPRRESSRVIHRDGAEVIGQAVRAKFSKHR